MSDQLRVGIIGVGWASMVQVPAFRAAGGYEVAALCSQRSARVAEAGRRRGIEDVTTDWQRFVRRPDLDVISVCTPTRLHREQVLAAAGAGKHVLWTAGPRSRLAVPRRRRRLDAGRLRAPSMADLRADDRKRSRELPLPGRRGRGQPAGRLAWGLDRWLAYLIVILDNPYGGSVSIAGAG
jgi:hypothetical protein